jgi:hypothetical protein
MQLVSRLVVLTGLMLFAGNGAAQAQADLSVAWIGRLPKIAYTWDSDNPRVVGWPSPGSKVTWEAHVRNLGSRQLRAVGFRWLLDGKQVGAGRATFPAGSLKSFRLARRWSAARQELVFEIDPGNAVDEVEERNNSLLVYTDGLGVGLWVESSFWSAMRGAVSAAGIGGTTFDDWMQLRIRQFNEMAAVARYPEAPTGVLDRWRIDEIHVVPDGALPLAPLEGLNDAGLPAEAIASRFPDVADRTVDLQWGFPASVTTWFDHADAWTLLYDSFIHELGHARYLIDVYAWNVSADNDIIGIPRLSVGHSTPEFGLMNQSWGFIDRYSAVAMNRIAGHRAIAGNYNPPSNLGSFLNDLPRTNRVRLVTPDGRTFPHRQVRIYRASGASDPDWQSHIYRLIVDGQSDAQLETDADGAVEVGRNPFADAEVVLTDDRNNALAIIELVDGSKSHWGFLESRIFNLAYWRGDTELAVHDLVLDEPVCSGPSQAPTPVTPAPMALVPSNEVTFAWPASLAAVQLWWAVDGGELESADIAPGTSSMTLSLVGKHVAWWIAFRSAASSACPPVRSATFLFDLPR